MAHSSADMQIRLYRNDALFKMSLTKVKNALINVPSAEINRLDMLGAEAPAQAEAPKTCTPFFISVMIFSPEAGFKYFVKVQKSCSAKNDPIWKLHFDLERIINEKFVRVLEIEIGVGTDGEEAKKVEKIAEDGITDKQSDIINKELFPITKVVIVEKREPTKEEAEAINKTMKKVINA